MSEAYLTEAEGAYLLRLARHTITQAVKNASRDFDEPPPTERLNMPGATFVTLHTKSGALRGCIGSLVARRPLIDDVRANALAAAFEDPRFPPVGASELANIVIEVSVLTKPEPLPHDGAENLIEKLRPGVDGVVIEQGWHRATFLPQVWDQLPTTPEFLTHLCYKAGLSGSAWRSGELAVSTYQVHEFEEET